MANKTYSISELAIQLNLPRTTINDWLKTFGAYLEYELRGKRKEYNQNALNVLKNICLWKNEGKSAVAIQKLLEENYGILGEVSVDNTARHETAENPADATAKTPAVNSGELMQVVHSDIELLLANVEQLNEKRIISTRRAARNSLLILFFILLLIGGIGYMAYKYMLRISNDNFIYNKNYADQLNSLRVENKDQLQEIEKLRKREIELMNSNSAKHIDEMRRMHKLEVEKLSKDFNIRSENFQKEIAAQKAELASTLKDLEKTVASRHEAEKIKLRENYAARQKLLLEQLSENKKNLSSALNTINELQRNLNDRNHTISKLRDELSSQQKVNSDLQQKNFKLSADIKRLNDSIKTAVIAPPEVEEKK